MEISETKEELMTAIDLLCEKLPMSGEYCQSRPEVFNLQNEYGSDEPYYVYEGGCESNDPDDCFNCVKRYFIDKAKRKVAENNRMLKCDKCKKKVAEVKDCFGTKLCFKCYSIQLEDENSKIKKDILFGLPDEYQRQIQEITNGKILSWRILHNFCKTYIKHLREGKNE